MFFLECILILLIKLESYWKIIEHILIFDLFFNYICFSISHILSNHLSVGNSMIILVFVVFFLIFVGSLIFFMVFYTFIAKKIFIFSFFLTFFVSCFAAVIVELFAHACSFS